MKIEKRSNKEFSAFPLRGKIVGGYVILIMLFGAILFMIWGEKQKLGALNTKEYTVCEKRKAINRTFGHLLNLSFMDDLLLLGDTTAFPIYCNKRAKAIAALMKLKEFYPSADQKSRIDTVCLLLTEKENHLLRIVKFISDQEKTIELLYQRMPSIVLQAQKETSQPEKKKSGFLGLFRKKENTKQQNQSRTVALLSSLKQDLQQNQEKQQRQLDIYIDSLRQRNVWLNDRLNQIISEFEENAMQKMEQEQTAVITEREQSFRTISLITVMSIFLVIILYVFIHRDITQKQAYRKQLEKSDRKKEELLNSRKNIMLTISHDLRAPLTTINGYAELLPDASTKEKRRNYSNAIRQASGRMLSLLNTMLNYYRLDIGKEQPESNPFRLKNVIEALTIEYHPAATKKQLDLIMEYKGGDVIVTGDRQKILQIAGNLLSNAIKFTAFGYVRLEMQYIDNQLSIAIEDSGSGMTEQQIEKIFKPFERLNNAETEEGFGLGLSITKSLADILGGRIEVTSTPGKGSCFTVYLPLPLCNEANLHHQNSETGSLPSYLRLAIVDNDAVLLAMTIEMLNRQNLHVDGCCSVKELMEKIRTNSYDLVITDIMMPDINGFQLLELLRTSNIGRAKTMPVIAMTARTEQDTETFIQAGFAGCIYKPFSRSELFAAILRCIGKHIPSGVEADFSMLLSGENDGKEMLGLLIRETRKNMSALAKGMEKGNREILIGVVHQLLPLWEVLGIDTSLKELDQRLSTTGIIDEPVTISVRTVLEVGSKLIEQAKRKEEGI